MPSDRNLLFGILALQIDSLTRDQLVTGMNAWVLDKAKPLGQILVDQGVLRPDHRDRLEGLVDLHLETHDHDPAKSLAALSALGSVREGLSQIGDADILTGLIPVSAEHGRHTLDSTAPSAAGIPTTAGARFIILRPHAKGNLGEVSVAFDGELDREVALKEIQERLADNSAHLRRFVLEAKVTGGLEHPGIVPVYGLSHFPDGRPYYVMRFIKGDSLQDAIQDFHKAEAAGQSPGERALALRKLLGRFLDVCNAIAYAHSRGVLHRDLKPANVMVGKYGETLVVDWGLAKVLGKTDVETPEELLQTASDPGLTHAGTALGTPAYMSPEQAAGNLDQVGSLSDVYSLGATLFCLLTGRAPFTNANMLDILRAVQRGSFPAPRSINRQVPAALEAICLKAMALAPADRYSSPRALADDIEHWLADEPVSAYREPWTKRLGRWRRRHATLVTATTLVLLTILLAAGLGVGVVGREKARERALAQVEALPHASPATVPAILQEIAAHRAEVRSRLLDRWQDQKLTDGDRLRLGLALADDREVRTRLIELARTATDPEDVLLARDAVVPYAKEVRPTLWELVDRQDMPALERFRLLTLLATLDPDHASWTRQAPGVVEQFVAANPLHLGAWKTALEPVRLALLEPLQKAFRTSTETERRRLVATLVADFARDRPAALADSLMDADDRQYAILWPRVLEHREQAITHLSRELEKTPPAPDWNDTQRWPPLPNALARQVTEAEGVVAERFALCQTLPLDHLDALAKGMSAVGYRLLQVRPYVAGQRVQVAAVWTRDSQTMQWAYGLTEVETSKQDAAWRAKGLVPLDVTAYLFEEKGKPAMERYAVLWGPKQAGMADARLVVGLLRASGKKGVRPLASGGLTPFFPDVLERAAYQETVQKLKKDGYRPRTQMGLARGKSLSHSGVWWKPVQPIEELAAVRDGTEEDYESSLTPSHLQTDLRLGWNPGRIEHAGNLGVAMLSGQPATGWTGVPWGAAVLARAVHDSGPLGLDFAAVWVASAERISAEVHGLEPAAHRVRCHELAAQGYRPVAVTVAVLRGKLVSGSVWQLPVVPDAAKEALAKRQAQAGVALLQLQQGQKVWPLFTHSPDPRRRSYLIHRLAPLATEPRMLIHQLYQEREPSRRRALVLSLGSFEAERVAAADRAELLSRLKHWYRGETDAGFHGAVEWLLRRWGHGADVDRIDEDLKGQSPGSRQWYINGQGQTLAVIPEDGPFWMGSPGAEANRITRIEPQHRVRIPRTFTIGTKEVTVRQFLRFRPNHPYRLNVSPHPDGPMINVSWYDAAAYCNWLSATEKIPPDQWCYEPSRDGNYGPGMQLAPDYLKRAGYRLPTEAEWEYAARAGAATSFYYGETEELLREYAWYYKTTNIQGVRAGALLKPNDWGLFDIYGNVFEWCQDPAILYRGRKANQAKEDKEHKLEINDNESRILRSGGFDFYAMNLRSATRGTDKPSNDPNGAGLRVARTYR
jgi:formylglycine-generating enzyme required for sulfatase activity/tRNA A-37 threonylcarbamoyl transferase component Bud32